MDPPAPDRLLRATSVLLDLNGVLYVEDEPIAGAVEARGKIVIQVSSAIL